MSTSELDSRNIAISMRKSVENLVISSQDAIGQSISQALTFSGVIAQNQMPPENKSVSRSPSPAPRQPNNDIAVDSLEYEKGCEMAIHVPSLGPAGDSVSLSGISDITTASAAIRDKAASSAARAAEAAGGPRAKKKSWYNSLYPTYKSKSDDFKRLFKDLPDDERLIVDYSCALQKDILAHGRLYASQNYLCFHASIFGWETIMSLRWKDVTAITKEKTALVIPNAILVCTEGEKHFLTSFSGRDKAYLMLFRVWQNALMDQPMTSQEIWQWVHSCYGEELGFNSDDEGYSRDLPSDVPGPPPDTPCELDTGTDYMWEAVAGAKTVLESNGIPCPDILVSPVDAEDKKSKWWDNDLAESSSMDASGLAEAREEGGNSSPPLVTNGVSEYQGAEGGDQLPTDMSDSSDSEPDKHHNSEDAPKCTSSHGGKLILQQQLPFNIDHLFTMIFTNSKFFLELLAARGASDYVQAPWQQQAGLKCRQVNYVLKLSTGPIGPKEVHVTETQVMNKCSKPGVLYSIDATSENSGIPYADYFTVEVHYCLQRVQEHVTELCLYGHVKYKKNMWPMVKAFLEKNSMSGLEDYARILDSRLSSEAESAAPAARKGRRHRRVTCMYSAILRARRDGRASSQETTVTTTVKPTAAMLAPRASLPRLPQRNNAAPWLVATLVVLLAINALLYWRLYYAERPGFDMEDLQTRMSSVSDSQMAHWSKQLERHTHRQRGQLLAWRNALDRTVTHLAQTEQALRKLLETIEPSLEKAQREAEQDNMPGHDPIRDNTGQDGKRSGTSDEL